MASGVVKENDLEANELEVLGEDGKISLASPTVVVKDETNGVSAYSTQPGSGPGLVVTEMSDEVVGIKLGGAAVLLPGFATEVSKSTRFYAGDVVVFKEDRRLSEWIPMFGTVLNPAPGSDMERSLDRGTSTEFHVHWDFTNKISLARASDVALVDRVLLRGQRVENSNGNVGTVVDYNITASVLVTGTENVLTNVSLDRLRPISPYVRGQEVLLQDWIGVITSIKRNVWFRMDGGLVFYMEVIESDGFTRVDPYWGLGVACPGMRTRLPASAFKRAIWVSRPIKFFNRFLPLQRVLAWSYSTIIRTEVTELEVMWLQPSPTAPENVQQPPSTVPRSQMNGLIVIGTPSTETVGINSVRKIQILPTDDIIKHEFWLEGFKKKFVDEIGTLEYPIKKPGEHEDLKTLIENNNSETPVKVLLRHNTVTVQWEDGSLEKTCVIAIPKVAPTIDDGEFPMGLTVAPVEKNSANGDKYGIVMASMELAKQRTRKVNVRWIIEGVDQGVEEVSCFDIQPHSKYALYNRGSILFPRNPSNSTFISAVVTDLNVGGGRMVAKTSQEHSQIEVYPHQVITLSTRCHWSFFTRNWILDPMVPPVYQLDCEFSPINRLVDVTEQKWDVLNEEDVNNPSDETTTIPTIWDEVTFELLAFAPESHRYHSCSKGETFGQGFARSVEKEIELLREKQNVPEGIWVRCYENRLDLISVLMVGPTKTPYEDGLFLFDVQLSPDFPTSIPAVHYVSYSHELHPLLSFDGNVCVGSIDWDPSEAKNSYIAHFLSKLQSLIFTPTPYFAHATTKQEESTEHGQIKARLYNQNVFVRVLDSLWNMIQRPYAPWERSIRNHFASAMPEKYFSIEKWINAENSCGEPLIEADIPSYSLFPVPDGMRMAVQKRIARFQKLTNGIPLVEICSVTDTTADSESFEVNKGQEEDAARMLTPIAEITEPSSTSTFGTKLSNITNITVPSDTDEPEHPESLDSLRNVKLSHKRNMSAESQSMDDDAEMNNSNDGVES